MNRILDRLRFFIKLGFSKRFLVAGILLVSFSLFGSFPNLWIRILALEVFFSCSALFIPFYLKESIYAFQQMRMFLTRVKLPIPLEFLELASKMHIKIRSFGVIAGRNACAAFGSLGLGKKLILELSPKEVLAVVAHELGHIKSRDSLKRGLLLTPLLLLALFSWSKLNSPIFYSEAFTAVMLSAMMLVALLAYLTVILVPINWNMEYGADEASRRFAGKGNLESALLKIAIAEKMDIDEQSETHPSINQRIDRLDKYGKEEHSSRLSRIFKRILSFGLSE